MLAAARISPVRAWSIWSRLSRLLLVSRCLALQCPDSWAPTMACADFCTITACIAAGRAVLVDNVAANFFDTQRAAHHGAWVLVSRWNQSGSCRYPLAPHAVQISPGKDRELSVHKRRIYPKRRTGGLCRHVPASPSALWAFYAVSVRRLAHLHSGFLQTVLRRPALAVG